MPLDLDLDPIRSRHAALDRRAWRDRIKANEDFDDSVDEFMLNADDDIFALLAEVESLRAENEGLRTEHSASIAVCPDCGEVTQCDEDRCCISCGRDLIVLADRHSADLLIELIGENTEPS